MDTETFPDFDIGYDALKYPRYVISPRFEAIYFIFRKEAIDNDNGEQAPQYGFFEDAHII